MADFIEYRKTIQKLVQEEKLASLIDLLQVLMEQKITPNDLKESQIGIAVGKLRKHTDAKIQSLSKQIVKKWKEEIAKPQLEHTEQKKPSVQTTVPKPVSKAPSPATPVSANVRNPSTDGIDIPTTHDKIRDKSIELLYTALAKDANADAELIMSRSVRVEEIIFKDARNQIAPEYKAKIRSLFLNLKDANNPSLREGVVSGTLSCERIARMPTSEMASEQRKQADKAIEADNIFNARVAEDNAAETDQFKCGKCKQRRCKYYQMQTRSADEPMTTYVTCLECGNKWKFS